MATHSSILVWEIPWTEKPGGSQGHKEPDTTEHACMQGTLSWIQPQGRGSERCCNLQPRSDLGRERNSF